MRRIRTYILVLLLVGTTASCGRFNDRMQGILTRAEILIDSCPDSSALYLKDITNPKWLTRGNYALYCLLRTQAADKTGQPFPSDSLIHRAVGYYENHPNDPHAIQAYYYLSRTLKNDSKAQVQALLKAEDYISDYHDDNLIGLIYYNIGEAYKKQYTDTMARTYYEKSLAFFRKTGKTRNEFSALNRIGWANLYLKDFDKAVSYFNEAKIIADNLGDTSYMYSVCNSLATVYKWKGDYDLVKRYVIQRIDLNRKDNSERSFSDLILLGDIYYQQGKLDSAEILYNQCNTIRFVPMDTARMAGVLLRLYRLKKQKGHYEKALSIFEEYKELGTAIQEEKQRNSIIEIKQKYDNEKLLTEKQQLTIRVGSLWIGFLLALFVAVTSLCIHKVVVTRKNKQISDDMVKLQEIEIDNQQRTIDNQRLKMQLGEMNLRKEGARNLIESKLRIIQKMNDILKLWSDDRRDNRRFGLAAKEFFDDYRFTQDSWKDIYEMANHIVSENFLNRLRQSDMKLSEDDLKLCCMIVVEIKTHQIADILGIQPTSVSKKRNRLKKKIAENSDKTLRKLLDSWL